MELGTGRGASTTVFIQACEEREGRLVSVDIRDCSDVIASERWQFVQSDSTDIAAILAAAPILAEGIDILYIDSLHRVHHVEKELMGWYPYMKERSWIFFDDIDPNPYRKGNRKDRYSSEIHWDAISEYVKAFFYANEDQLYLDFSFGSTGLAKMLKLSPKGALPNRAKPIIHRKNTLLNRVRYRKRYGIPGALLRLFRPRKAAQSR